MDWQRLFEDNNIDFTTRGPNTSHGWVSISCPWCGDNDPSMHLGCNPAGYFNCWRDATHKGNAPHRLIARLLGVTAGRARLVAQTYGVTGPDGFDALTALKTAKTGQLSLDEFSPIQRGGLTHGFYQYLEQRGFDDIESLINQYCLKACLSGRFAGRIIIPVYDEGNTLVGWQGRAITDPIEAPRYLGEGNIKDILFNLQNLKGGHALYICEGPFDVLKIDFYGQPQARATCTFGVVPKPQQLNLLRKLRSQFQRIILLLDADGPALQAGYYFSDCLPGVEFGSLPQGIHDPGSLTRQQVMEVINET